MERGQEETKRGTVDDRRDEGDDEWKCREKEEVHEGRKEANIIPSSHVTGLHDEDDSGMLIYIFLLLFYSDFKFIHSFIYIFI